MPKENFPMTEAGLEKIKKELNALEMRQREHAKERIKKARSFCDFHEDSEYELALKELAHIEERISNLTYMIKHVEIIEKSGTADVSLGSTVTFKDCSTDETETYMIVGSEESNPSEGKISNQSQVAQSLLGARVGDRVVVKTPSGDRQVNIECVC